MKSNYSNKMQSPDLTKQARFAQFSPAIQAAIKARYEAYKIATLQVCAKPMELSEWLEKEGY